MLGNVGSKVTKHISKAFCKVKNKIKIVLFASVMLTALNVCGKSSSWFFHMKLNNILSILLIMLSACSDSMWKSGESWLISLLVLTDPHRAWVTSLWLVQPVMHCADVEYSHTHTHTHTINMEHSSLSTPSPC